MPIQFIVQAFIIAISIALVVGVLLAGFIFDEEKDSVKVCAEFSYKQEGFMATPYKDSGCRIGYGSPCLKGEVLINRDDSAIRKEKECEKAYKSLSSFKFFKKLNITEKGILSYIFTNTTDNLESFMKKNPNLSTALERQDYKRIEFEIYNQCKTGDIACICKKERELMVFRGHSVDDVFRFSRC